MRPRAPSQPRRRSCGVCADKPGTPVGRATIPPGCMARTSCRARPGTSCLRRPVSAAGVPAWLTGSFVPLSLVSEAHSLAARDGSLVGGPVRCVCPTKSVSILFNLGLLQLSTVGPQIPCCPGQRKNKPKKQTNKPKTKNQTKTKTSKQTQTSNYFLITA